MNQTDRRKWADLRRETLGDLAYWQTAHAFAHQISCRMLADGQLLGARLAQREQALAHRKMAGALRLLEVIEGELRGAGRSACGTFDPAVPHELVRRAR